MWAWLLGVATTFLGSSVARWIAFKTLFIGIMMVTLPIILNNIIYKIIDISANLAGEYSEGVASWVGSFSGLTAFLLSCVRAPEVVSIIMAAVAVRYTLNLIPFVRV